MTKGDGSVVQVLEGIVWSSTQMSTLFVELVYTYVREVGSTRSFEEICPEDIGLLRKGVLLAAFRMYTAALSKRDILNTRLSKNSKN